MRVYEERKRGREGGESKKRQRKREEREEKGNTYVHKRQYAIAHTHNNILYILLQCITYTLLYIHVLINTLYCTLYNTYFTVHTCTY